MRSRRGATYVQVAATIAVLLAAVAVVLLLMQKPWQSLIERASDEISGRLDEVSDAYEDAMRSDLKNLVYAQLAHQADAHTFASRLSDVTFYSTTGVSVTVTAGGPDGWSAQATAVGSNKTCYIFAGDPVKYGTGPAREAEKPVCI